MSVQSSTTADPAPQVGATRRSVMRHRQFGLLFVGQALSAVGDRLFMVAMPFAVLSLPGAGAGDVGLVLGASALSLAMFVLVGGVMADRLPRQLTMLASDVVRGLAQAASAAVLLTDHATVTNLVVLQAVYGGAEAFFRPAMLGLVPQVVDAGDEQAANALLSLSTNLSMVLAPALAGVLVIVLGPGGALAVDAATFAVSAATLSALRPRSSEKAEPGHFLADLAGGWREVRTRSWVWSTLIAFSAYHALVLPALFVLGPQVANDIRDGASSWGWITAGFGVGAVTGSLLAVRWKPSRPGVTIGSTLCLASAQAAICASSLPTWAVAGFEAVTGVGVALCFTLWETALQERIPASAQSRVSSFDYLGSLTLMPLGYVLVGPLSSSLGTRPAAVGASVVTGAICLAVAFSRGLRRLQRLPVVPAGT
ncbi:MAG: putative major facilitator superfamily transporter [Frankiales bacterium]|nr:putative major facilitator superfamily transporter [Frankiales bacterium]